MHALIVHDNKAERDSIASVLTAEKYRVDTVAVAAAAGYLDRESPELVIVGWHQAAPLLVRRIRSRDADKRAYILATLDKLPASVIPTMFDAGVDDFMRTPIVREELIARAAAPQRIKMWASPGATTNGEGVELAKLKAFTQLGSIVTEDLAQIVGPLAIQNGWSVNGELRGAFIPMTVASEQAEIRVSIVVEAKLLRTLAGILLGDENAPNESLDDMLREIANTAGGAVKRAAELENVNVTTGLPVNGGATSTQNETTSCWTAVLDSGVQARIGIIGEIRKQKNQRIPLAKAAEGMVITHDLRNESGALILPAGARLTQTSVGRMRQLLGPRFVIDVTLQ